MRFSQLVASCVLGLAASSIADTIPENHYLWGPGGAVNNAKLEKRATTTTSSSTSSTSLVADAACTNGALTRSCWSNGYSVATDFDAKWPSTGVTRSYSLTVTNGTCNPDGNGARTCLLFNNQYPGPLIWANWGDTISVTVTNNLQYNGTGVHWHGVRQLKTNQYDGVPGITECPLAPKDSKTYTFQATQFGTSWYHSHVSAQYGDGLLGPLVIYGPASANYDIDAGPLMVSDWYYPTADQVSSIAQANLQQGQPPPPADALLVNGTAVSTNGGSYVNYSVTKGKKYLFRLINTSVDNGIVVSFDNHTMQIVTGDFVPIKPINVQSLVLAIGQRYEVIVNFNQTAGNYWFRADVAAQCASANNGFGRAIITYAGTTAATPTSVSSYTPANIACQDVGPLVPWVSNTVPSTNFISQAKNLNFDINVEQVTTNNQSIVVWGINMTAIDINWEMPTLEYIKTGNTSYPSAYNLIEIPNGQTWTYWIIQETNGVNTTIPIPHPVHLHGHDFYVLGSGSGVFDPSTQASTLAFNNPYRRDVTWLPGGGWVVLAFPTDNPGAWLFHCHIAWHVSSGLGVQFLESKSSINLPGAAWETTCSNFKTFWDGPHPYQKDDSGL